MPTFSQKGNKRKKDPKHTGHSKIMTSATWIAEQEAVTRKREEKAAVVAARKEAAAARKAARLLMKAAAAADHPWPIPNNKGKVAAKALWKKQELNMRNVLWPAAGEEDSPECIALLEKLVPIAGCANNPTAAAEARRLRRERIRSQRLLQQNRPAGRLQGAAVPTGVPADLDLLLGQREASTEGFFGTKSMAGTSNMEGGDEGPALNGHVDR